MFNFAHSIIGKMLISILLTTLICFGIAFGYILYSFSSQAKINADKFTRTSVKEYTHELETKVNSAEKVARGIVNALEALKASNELSRDNANTIIKGSLQKNDMIFGAWTVWEPNAFDGKDQEFANSPNYDHTGRFVPYWFRGDSKIEYEVLKDYDKEGAGDYYLNALRSEKESVIDPYEYEINGVKYIFTTISVPISVNGRVVGVAGVDIVLNSINDILKNIKFYETGYCTLVTSSGKIIYHPNQEMINKNIIDLTSDKSKPEVAKTLQNAEEFKLIEFSKVTKMNVVRYYQPLYIGNENNSWCLISVIPEKEILAEANKTLKISMIICLLGSGILCILVYFISKSITKPILRMIAAATEVAEGNLTIKAEYGSKDEVGKLSSAISKMIESLRELILKVQGNAHEVAVLSEELATSSEQSAQASSQIASSIVEVSSNTEEQFVAVNNAKTEVERIASSINEISGRAEKVADMASKTSISAREGNSSLDQATKQMENIKNSVNLSSEIILKLEQRSNTIGDIVETISKISEQTNLLALNAAIEAARAGEHGRGFSVLAEEVGKLAESSHKATQNISDIIKEIQNETNIAVKAMNNGTNEVGMGIQLVNSTGDVFDKIVNMIEDVSGHIKEISGAINYLSKSGESLVSTINNIEDSGKKSSIKTQLVASAMEEQSATIEEIAASSSSLSKLAQDLQQVSAFFKI